MPDINKLIEMALDFSDIGLDDPFDPETHGATVGQRVRVYVASTTKHFWDIVRNGMHGVQVGKSTDRHKVNIFFDQMHASDRAHGLSYDENNKQHDGPVKGLVFVCEKKVLKMSKPGASIAAQIAAKVGAIQTPMVDTHIQPRDIVGVVFPAEGHKFATPIRKFVQQAKWGHYEDEGLPGPGEKITGMKFGRVTPDDWQHALVRYVQDLFNYSSNYYDYLTGDQQNNFLRAILAQATRTGRSTIMHFTPRQMMEWIYSFLPTARDPDNTGHDKESDILQILHSTEYDNHGLPFWRLYDRYHDDYSYDVLRGAKEPPIAR